MTRIGSLCTGYGGLDAAVEEVIGGELAWVADIDPGASAILAHRFPSLPNLGDISTADWSAVEPVDVLTAGFPCQDVSCAGGRAGLREGNRTGVWAYVARAIDELRPSLVVLENVRGLLSAGADSDLESCAWCVGEAGNEHPLRALGAVLGDLADLGYDARWAVVSAVDTGAPHRRERVFITARPAAEPAGVRLPLRQPEHLGRGSGAAASPDRWHTTEHDGIAHQGSPHAADADRTASGEWRITAPGEAESGWPRADASRRGGAPAADSEHDGRTASPAAGTGEGAQQGQRGSWRVATESAGDGGQRTAVIPPVRNADRSDSHGRAAAGQPREAGSSTGPTAWGPYELAIRRWEHVTSRPAPRPTEPGRTGERLSPRFVEWMMGLLEGWVTDVPGLSRNAQLKALGNGVVPQQAAMALRLLLDRADIAPLVTAEEVA